MCKSEECRCRKREETPEISDEQSLIENQRQIRRTTYRYRGNTVVMTISGTFVYLSNVPRTGGSIGITDIGKSHHISQCANLIVVEYDSGEVEILKNRWGKQIRLAEKKWYIINFDIRELNPLRHLKRWRINRQIYKAEQSGAYEQVEHQTGNLDFNKD